MRVACYAMPQFALPSGWGFISWVRIGLVSVDLSSDSELSEDSEEFASCICFHLHMGKFSMMSLLSAVWYGVARVASGLVTDV